MNQFKFAHKQGLGPMNLEDIDLDELWTKWARHQGSLKFKIYDFAEWLWVEPSTKHKEIGVKLLVLWIKMGLIEDNGPRDMYHCIAPQYLSDNSD